MTMPSTIRIKQGIALRADLAGIFFLEPADLNFAMLPFQCRSIVQAMRFKVITGLSARVNVR
jgi:hypothetical protein